MMSSYKINYNKIRQLPEIKEMLSALERGLNRFSIDYYLVGAVARDVWMTGINGIAPRRTTGDIDFAVLINDKGVYDALKNYLIEEECFAAYKANPYVLIWEGRYEVDLLPFGAIEDENGYVIAEGTGLTNISLQGFYEIYEEGLPEIELEGNHRFKFCTLPGIVTLKLIAWDDRPEIRRDDVKDISDILNHFFDMYDEKIWEGHNDLFEGDNVDLKHVAARVMGREMRKIADRSRKLFDRLNAILDANTSDMRNSRMANIMVEYFDNTVEDNVILLSQVKLGLNGN